MAAFPRHELNGIIIDNVNTQVFQNRKDVPSISKIINWSKKQFDKECMSQHCFEKYYDDPSSKYYHKTAEEIKESWTKKSKSACSHGSTLDEFFKLVLTYEDDNELRKILIEKLKQAKLNEDERTINLYRGVDSLLTTLKICLPQLEFCDREKYVYYTTKKGNVVRGRFDALFYDPKDNEYHLFDWKNSAKIKMENHWEKFINPYISTLDECNFNEYSIQLIFYKKALETNYNLDSKKIATWIGQIPGCLLYENEHQYGYYKVYKVKNDFIYDNIDNIIDEAIDMGSKQQPTLLKS